MGVIGVPALSLEKFGLLRQPLFVLALSACAAGCTSVGPGAGTITSSPEKSGIQGIQIVEASNAVVIGAKVGDAAPGFAETFSPASPVGTVVGPGDVLEVSIWEAPPATLFGSAVLDSRAANSIQTSRGTGLPEFLVPVNGRISIPFAGSVPVSGKTLQQIERDIVGRLSGKAHLPQAIVRLVRNATATVTIVGEVANSTRLPLTPKGERLLDALAAAGGTRQPTGKMTIQLSRNGVVHSMPLSSVIREPQQNVVLQTNDVITAIYQPYSFTVLGATGRNAEVEFEATGLTFSQALGRIGGLQDMRANPKGVFLFRWEPKEAMPGTAPDALTSADGRVPVIYRINLKDPGTYFAMQNFPIRDKDVLFVSNAPSAEFQRFVSIIASTALPLVTVDNAIRRN